MPNIATGAQRRSNSCTEWLREGLTTGVIQKLNPGGGKTRVMFLSESPGPYNVTMECKVTEQHVT